MDQSVTGGLAAGSVPAVFLHIPKTAGTTLYHILDRNYRKSTVYTIWQDGSLDGFKQLSQADRAQVQLLRGHFGYGIHTYLPRPCVYFTFLRNPLARTVSYYHFVRHTPAHYCHDLVVSRGLNVQQFVESGQDPLVDNAQTRLLAGLETGQELPVGGCTRNLLERARHNLRENIAVTGIVEEFDAALLIMKRTFGWRSVYYAEQNVTPTAARPPELSPSARAAIEQVNELDVELYADAREIFAASLRQAGAAFETELSAFQQKNRWLRPVLRPVWAIPSFSLRTKIRNVLAGTSRQV
jgi:hypothetical protein